MTFDFPESDVKMANYLLERAVEIARLMGGETIASLERVTPYSVVPLSDDA